jgi:hypothetical protein
MLFAILGLCDVIHSTFEWIYSWCINPCLNDMPNSKNHFLLIQKACFYPPPKSKLIMTYVTLEKISNSIIILE